MIGKSLFLFILPAWFLTKNSQVSHLLQESLGKRSVSRRHASFSGSQKATAEMSQAVEVAVGWRTRAAEKGMC